MDLSKLNLDKSLTVCNSSVLEYEAFIQEKKGLTQLLYWLGLVKLEQQTQRKKSGGSLKKASDVTLLNLYPKIREIVTMISLPWSATCFKPRVNI